MTREPNHAESERNVHSLDNLCAAGSGFVEFSFVVAGLPEIFTSSERMTGTDTLGRTRIPAIDRSKGLGFSERIRPAQAELDVQVDQIEVIDIAGGAVTDSLNTRPRRVDSLTSTLLAAATTANVNDSSLFPDGFYHLGFECVEVTARPSGTTISITRARYQTLAQDHVVSVGERAQVASFWDRPPGLKGRRCYLYAHTETELSLSSPTTIWRGVLSREPALGEDLLAYSFGIESRMRLLEGNLAGGFDENAWRLRGIYLPAEAPIRLSISRWSGASIDSGTVTTETVALWGFWETQESFCTALKAALDAHTVVSTWGVTWDVRILPDGTWELAVTIAGTPRYISVTGGSRVDGALFRSLGFDRDIVGEVPISTGVVSASVTYRVLWNTTWSGTVPLEDLRLVPRSNNFAEELSSGLATDADIAAYPVTRLYLTQLASLVDGDLLFVTPQVSSTGAALEDGAPGASPIRFTVDVDAATSSADLEYPGVAALVSPRVVASGGTQPTITAAALFVSLGSLNDFRAALLDRTPELVNRGQAPDVSTDDIAAWSSPIVEQAAGRPFLTQRAYAFSQPVKAIEVLTEDWKLYGLFPYLNEDARIAVRPLAIDAAEIRDVIIELDDSNILVDENLGHLDIDPEANVCVVNVLTGYDPTEDKHKGQPIFFHGLEAIARTHEEALLKIEPKSRAFGAEPTWEDVSSNARSVIEIFGTRRHSVYQVDVTLECFSVLCGDWISLTSPALPYDGSRTEWTAGSGMVQRPAMVVGRKWNVAGGEGTFDVLVSDAAEDVGGYCPSAKVNSASGSGTDWTLTCTQSHYSDTDDLGFFISGMAIRLVEWDAASPVLREGTVAGTPTATTIPVKLATSWTGFGAATRYTLLFDTSDDTQTTAVQLGYALSGGATQRLPLTGGGSTIPKRLA